jgi:hypothetical protein
MSLTATQNAWIKDRVRGLTAAQQQVLALVLAARDGFSIRILAAACGVSRQTIYNTMKRLVVLRLVVTEPLRELGSGWVYYARPGAALQAGSAFREPWPDPPRSLGAAPTAPKDPLPPRGRRLVEALGARGLTTFKALEAQLLAYELGIRSHVRNLLLELIDKGALERLRYGVYRLRSPQQPAPPLGPSTRPSPLTRP